MSEGIKHDGKKLRWSLLPWRALERVVEVLEFGARKYSPDNWKKVEDGPQRYKDALMRHTAAIMQGEIYDPESGKTHYAHLSCCALYLAEFIEMGKVKEDEVYAKCEGCGNGFPSEMMQNKCPLCSTRASQDE